MHHSAPRPRPRPGRACGTLPPGGGLAFLGVPKGPRGPRGPLEALDDGSMTIMTQQRCISLGRLGKERGWIYRIMNNVNMESRFCKIG